MNIAAFILNLERLGIRFKLNADQLALDAPKGILKAELVEEIRSRKEEIIEFLNYRSKQDKYSSIPEAPDKEFYPLSSAQQRLYLLQQLDPESTAYNMPMLIPLAKSINFMKLQSAFSELMFRHESLQTYFEVVDDQPVQKIGKAIKPTISNEKSTDEDARTFYQRLIRPFKLNEPPLLRLCQIETKEDFDYLLLDMHHIISDGISQEILKRDFWNIYNGVKLPSLRLQYKDYAEWENSTTQKIKIVEQEIYWLNKFTGEIPILNLPYDFPNPKFKGNEGASVQFSLQDKELDAIRILCKENDLTLYMCLLAVVNILMMKLTGDEDIIIGTPVTTRRHVDLQDIVGLFINTLALRNKIDPAITIKEYLSQIKFNVLESFENCDFPFEKLVDKVLKDRDLSRSPLFTVMFNLLSHHEMNEFEFIAESREHLPASSKFDLTITASENANNIQMCINYSTCLFAPQTIDRYIEYIRQIILQLCPRIEKKVSSIEILPATEKEMLLSCFNKTNFNYPKEKNIRRLFEDQVAKNPNKLALIFGDNYLSFEDLNNRSNYIAHQLIHRGIGRNSIVAILMDISLECIISIFGVLKAGSCFLPIDIQQPQERIKYILQDSCCNLMITNIASLKESPLGIELLYINGNDINGMQFNPPNQNEPGDPAYIIYTSGTTGRPKGVVITNESLLNYTLWFTNKTALTTADKTALVTSYAFDLGYTAVYSALLSGCELHLLPKTQLSNVSDLLIYIVRNTLTYLKLTPSFYSLFLEEQELKEALDTLRLIVLGGEPLHADIVEKTISTSSNTKILNHYGPTETTIGCISHFIDNTNFSTLKNMVVIGKPIYNAEIFILDSSNDELVPIGVVGEICIGGKGVGRGYLNNVELTAERFVSNPFREGELMYRSGDMGKWLSDGSVVFMGRRDSQVKIRGYRVEPAEIEQVLLGHEEVKECVVLTRDQGSEIYLCAYVVGSEKDTGALRQYLSAKLPYYMVPRDIVIMNQLPLNANGKIDRNALPLVQAANHHHHQSARNQTEEKLVSIWSEVLSLSQENISVTTNFFELGGHSLKAMILASKVRKEFASATSIRDIFFYPTIEQLASYIKSTYNENDASLLEELKQMSSEELEAFLNE